MDLQSLTSPELIFPGLRAADSADLLSTLAEKIAAQGAVSDARTLYEKLWEREQLGSTGVGSGVAIPHCKMNGLRELLMAVGLLEQGIDFAAVDGQPVRIFFCVISPSNSPAAHLQCLAAISRWVKTTRHLERILELRDSAAVYRLLGEESA